MADNSVDLRTALQMFRQGAQEFGLAQAISSAQEKVQQIKMAGLKDAEQRRALGDLAQQLTGRMIGLGASAAAVQQAAGSVMPAQYSSADQAIFQGTLSGDKEAVAAGMAAQNAQRQDELMMLKAKSNIAEGAQARLFAQQEKMAALHARKAKKSEDISFETNVKSANNIADQLTRTIQKAGNWELMDSKQKAILNQAAYDLAISYAKIVDPSSVAREGEVAAAQKYMLPMGPMTRNSLTLESIKQFKNKINERVKARQEVMGEQQTQPDGAAPKSSISNYLE